LEHDIHLYIFETQPCDTAQTCYTGNYVLAAKLESLGQQLEAVEIDPKLKSELRQACELASGLAPVIYDTRVSTLCIAECGEPKPKIGAKGLPIARLFES
jgi:hypothetical protein